MKTNGVAIWTMLIFVLISCQSVTATPIPTSAAQVQTQVAATIYTNQTSTAAVEEAAQPTLTAVVPSETNTPRPTSTSSMKTVYLSLPASSGWINTEVEIHAGQTVAITASGEVNTWEGREGSSGGPDGQLKSTCGAVECPLQGANYGALIGRLENGKPFLVGKNLNFTASTDGQLYLTVNDWKCSDNFGAFTIVITIRS